MKQYKVVKNFNDNFKGDLVWLNERRAKSELRNGNVIELEIKQDMGVYRTKEEKIVKATKKVATKKPVAKRAKKK